MRKILIGISLCGLVLTLFPAILVLMGKIELKDHFTLMIIGMVLWFSTAPFWMKSKSLDDTE